MIRVLHIMSTVTGGGVERTRYSLSKLLNREIFQLKIVGTYKGGMVSDWIEEQGVEIIEIGDFSGPFDRKKHTRVQKIIEAYKPHIIHGAVYEGVTLAAINGFVMRVPIIILEETSDPQNRSAKASFLLRVFSWFSDKYIAIAPSVSRYLLDVVRVSHSKVVCINNGIEIPRFVSDEEIQRVRSSVGITLDDFVVGAVGRFMNHHKRFSDLIESFRYLNNERVKILFVGSGKDEDYLRSKVNELGLHQKVIFAGYQFDTAPYYKLMNVFCLPSAYEGFGLVAAEAMMHKLPVIASKVGGLKEVVVEGVTGFLVPPYSPELLAQKIIHLLDHPDERRSMGEKGYQRAMEHYTAERYCREVEDLYLELLKKKGVIS